MVRIYNRGGAALFTNHCVLTTKKNPFAGSFLYFYQMILNKFKSLLAILLLASTCLWAEPIGTSGKSSDDERSYWIDIALFFGSWVGTTTGDVNKYLDVKMGFPFIIDFELQLSRVAVGFYYGWGLIHSLPYLYDGVCFTDGYCFRGADFNAKAIVKEPTNGNLFALKIIDNIDLLNSVYDEIHSTIEIYQFFSSSIYYENTVYKHIKIPFENVMEIENMI